MGDSLRVFIVEDNDVMLGLYHRILDRDGSFDVVGECGDAGEGWDRLRCADAEVCLFDENVSGGTGSDLARRLHESGRDLPVLLISGCGVDEGAVRRAAPNVAAVMGKEEMVQRLAPALRKIARRTPA